MATAARPMTQHELRRFFPSLSGGFAYLENAGGSQVPSQVIERMRALMLEGYVQTTAGYPASDVVDLTVRDAKRFANVLTNGDGVGLTVIGPSTTDLLYRLSNSLAHTVSPGDEIVVSVANHEANIGPWVRLQERGAAVKWWGVDRETGAYSYEQFASLLTPRTRLVAVPHTSNILGDILDVRRVAEMAHAVGATVVVDGVAFAPHTAMDVQAFGADFYACSLYKVYGPHIALLFGTHEAWSKVHGPNHFFIANDDLPWKFEMGCQPYEALAGLLGTGEYLAALAGGGGLDRPTVERAFAAMREFEMPVQHRIGDYLAEKTSVRLVGPNETGRAERHPTFSFLHATKRSDEVVKAVNGPKIGIRYGHMYAARLCEALGAPLETGFVRVSAVHYNTLEEADGLIEALEVDL